MPNENPSPQSFDFFSLRFEFRALQEFVFPPLLSANIFRGAFGFALRQTSPLAYQQCFAPPRSLSGPSGLADPPRPFVFRTRHLDGSAIRPNETFHVDLNLLQPEPALVPDLTQVFAEMGRRGFGPQRSSAKLLDCSCTPRQCSLRCSSDRNVQRIRIEFLTPTELKSSGALSPAPQFDILLRRTRDRISNLRALYGPGPLQIDFEAFTNRAAQVELTSNQTQQVQASRRSSRTGQTHPLGGFTGAAEYTGPLTEFLPYLEIAAHTGVGRQTVWGKGEITTDFLTIALSPVTETRQNGAR